MDTIVAAVGCRLQHYNESSVTSQPRPYCTGSLDTCSAKAVKQLDTPSRAEVAHGAIVDLAEELGEDELVDHRASWRSGTVSSQ